MAKNENTTAAETQPAAEMPAVESQSLLALVRAARVATVAQIQVTPLDELNRVRTKLEICEQILAELPAAAISGR